MSENDIKKIEEGQEVLGTIKIDDSNISWDELEVIYSEMAKEIIDLQLLITTMAKQHAAKIDSDKKLFGIVAGLLLTISDVSKEIADIRKSYCPTAEAKKGPISKNDEESVLIYLTASSQYVSAGEKFANLSSTAITDILAMLKLDDGLLKQAEDLQKTIANKEI